MDESRIAHKGDVQLMTALNIVGNPFGQTGYSVHTEQFALAMDRVGVDVSIETVPITKEVEAAANPKILELIKKTPNRDTWNLIINLPYYWSQKSFTNRNIGYGVFEGSRIHTSWRHCANKPFINQIWVPSTHTRDAFVNGGVEKPISIIPHGVDTNLFNPLVKPIDNMISDQFTFMFAGGWSQGEKDRKGLDIVLRAFTEEFKKTENVRFIAKINSVYNKQNYNLADEIKKLNLKSREERAEFQIVTQDIPYRLLPSVYKLADVFVFPTKAEGFGMTALEAMACGVPVISTNYGGQVDFINKENGWLIDGVMSKATDENVFYEEANWMIPNQNDIQKAMREAFENRLTLRQKAESARRTSEEFTWDKSAMKAKAILEALK